MAMEIQRVVEEVDANSSKEDLLLNVVEMRNSCSFTFLRKFDLSNVSPGHSTLLQHPYFNMQIKLNALFFD